MSGQSPLKLLVSFDDDDDDDYDDNNNDDTFYVEHLSVQLVF